MQVGEMQEKSQRLSIGKLDADDVPLPWLQVCGS